MALHLYVLHNRYIPVNQLAVLWSSRSSKDFMKIVNRIYVQVVFFFRTWESTMSPCILPLLPFHATFVALWIMHQQQSRTIFSLQLHHDDQDAGIYAPRDHDE